MTDQELLSEVQLAVLEPVDGGATWPSEVWTLDEVLDNVNAAVRSLLRDTMILVVRTDLALIAGATAATLPDDWLKTISVTAFDQNNNAHPLHEADLFELDHANPRWDGLTAPPPAFIAYGDFESTTLTIRVGPAVNFDTTIEVVYAYRPAEVTGRGAALPVQDIFASVIKYGTLETMLSKVGRMQDPKRAAYCRQRVDVATLAADLLMKGLA